MPLLKRTEQGIQTFIDERPVLFNSLALGSCAVGMVAAWSFFPSIQDDLDKYEETAASIEIEQDEFKVTDIHKWSSSDGGYQYKMELNFDHGRCQLPATADVVMGEDFIPKDVRNYTPTHVKSPDGLPYVFQDQQSLLAKFGPNPCVTLDLNDNPASARLRE